ncbi:hypothetical protein BFV98_30390 [Micromonospora sp. WMMB235]|nr:hypothetical protein BFV98_30390 [Micromonospora sp. WMMB235]
MATPRLAAARAGASLTPSPTSSTRRPLACTARTWSTLSCGSSPACTSVIPASAARCPAAPALSPVSSIGLAPVRRVSAMTASERIRSARASTPTGVPSTITTMAVWPVACASAATARAWATAMGVSSSSRTGLPTATCRPLTTARTPRPGTDVKSAAAGTGSPWSCAAARTAAPTGCSPGVLGPGGKPQHLLRAGVADGVDVDDAGMAFGEGAGLVERHPLGVGEVFHHHGGLDQDAVAAGEGDRGQ